MKFKVLILLCWLGLTKASAKNIEDMERIRFNYARAVSDKKLCRQMMAELDQNAAHPVHLAYLGAFRVIWAKHTLNPFARLNTFNKGKKDIERAVLEQPHNVEIRFIRLSVQKNCPSFLGYNTEIAQDSKFIDSNKNTITSTQLKKMIALL